MKPLILLFFLDIFCPLNFFLNYRRRIIEYLLFAKQTTPQQRSHLSQLWHDTLHLRWGPLFRFRSAAKQSGFLFEDPIVLPMQNTAHSVDETLD